MEIFFDIIFKIQLGLTYTHLEIFRCAIQIAESLLRPNLTINTNDADYIFDTALC